MTGFKNGLGGIALAAAMVPTLSAPTLATENGNSQYFGGGAQFFAGAIPPDPGLYFLSQASYFTTNRINDNSGKDTGLKVNITAFTEALCFLYVSDLHLAGGTAWAKMIAPVLHIDGKITGGGRTIMDDSRDGLADVTFASGLAWTAGKHSFTASLDLGTPTGSYKRDRALNAGVNHWSIHTDIGYKYFDPEGLEISLNPRLIINTENQATNYTSGTELYIDYAVGWNVGKWQLGVLGYYYQQLTDDSGPTAPADGNRGSAFAIGPSIAYNLKPGVVINMNWQHELTSTNGTQGDTIWLNITTPL